MQYLAHDLDKFSLVNGLMGNGTVTLFVTAMFDGGSPWAVISLLKSTISRLIRETPEKPTLHSISTNEAGYDKSLIQLNTILSDSDVIDRDWVPHQDTFMALLHEWLDFKDLKSLFKPVKVMSPDNEIFMILAASKNIAKGTVLGRTVFGKI